MRFSEIVNESATSDAKLFAKGLLEYAEEAITHTKQFRDEWAMSFHFALVDAAEAIEENDFLKAEKYLNKAIGSDSHTKEEILSYFESEYGEEGLAAAERFLKGIRLNEVNKSTFKNKLRYEWLDELQTRVKNFNMTTAGQRGWRVDLYADENPIRIVLSRVDGNSTLHTMEIWMAQLVLSPLATDYPVDFKEVDREPRAITKYPNVTYVALPRVTEAKMPKDEFHRKLADPAAQELHEIRDTLRKVYYPMRFKLHDADKDAAIIECIAPWDDEGEYVGHLKGANFVRAVESHIVRSEHWVWDATGGRGDADDVLYFYVTRK